MKGTVWRFAFLCLLGVNLPSLASAQPSTSAQAHPSPAVESSSSAVPVEATRQVDASLTQEELADISLEDLLDVFVVSRSVESPRAAPAVTTVISREEIADIGARDLMDVINAVPGLSITTDLFDVGALSSRGLYAFEGRGLVMVDGLPMNGSTFNTYALGHDFPIHLVERIEVIRGPGSVVYGGSAELVVINIVTARHGVSSDADASTDHASGAVSARYGVLDDITQLGHRDVGATASYASGSIRLNLLASVGQGARGQDEERFDAAAEYAPLPDYSIDHRNSGTRNMAAALTARVGDLGIRANYQRHRHYWLQFPTEDRALGYEGKELRSIDFDVANVALSYDAKITPEFTVTPELRYHYDLEWADYPRNETNLPNHHITAELLSRYERGPLHTMIGAEVGMDVATTGQDTAHDVPLRPYQLSTNDAPTDRVSFLKGAVFGNARYILDAWHLNGGVRWDWHDTFGHQLSPRVGLAYVTDMMFAKAIYSRAFRAPNIAASAISDYSLVASADPDERFAIQNESSWNVELQAGADLGETLSIEAGTYYQRVSNMIVFDPDYGYKLKNGGALDSWGIEGTARASLGDYRGSLAFSQTAVGHMKEAVSYLAPATPDASGNPRYRDRFLGVPTFKIFTNHAYAITDDIGVHVNALYYGERLQHRYDAAFDAVSNSVPAQIIFGLGARWADPLGATGLELRLDVHDLLDQELRYVSSFDSYFFASHPFSSMRRGREMSLTASFSM